MFPWKTKKGETFQKQRFFFVNSIFIRFLTSFVLSFPMHCSLTLKKPFCIFFISFSSISNQLLVWNLGLFSNCFSSQKKWGTKKLRCPNNSDALVFVWTASFKRPLLCLASKSVLKFNEAAATHLEVSLFYDGLQLCLQFWKENCFCIENILIEE